MCLSSLLLLTLGRVVNPITASQCNGVTLWSRIDVGVAWEGPLRSLAHGFSEVTHLNFKSSYLGRVAFDGRFLAFECGRGVRHELGVFNCHLGN